MFVRDENNALRWRNKPSKEAAEEEQRANQILSSWHFYLPNGKETEASTFANNQIK